MSINWQPSASIENLKVRASLLKTIRDFFYARNIMEVETPTLSQASVTDIHLASFSTQFVGPGFAKGLPLYLQTSPEFAMKRLLAAGSGAIFQLAKAFRNEEAGRHHNPEFTMLEWYRPGLNAAQLMDEIDELMIAALGCNKAERISYQNAFITHLQCDPLTVSIEELTQLAKQQGFDHIAEQENDKDTLLQLLFCMCIEPKIGQQRPCFVYHFPASQAALAKLNTDDNRVAERFELYFKGMELANGFDELTEADEQRQRFIDDNNKRKALGLVEVPVDERFLAALSHGLPQCSGVALGVDRLIMLALDAERISDVIAFDVERA
jgi:lysyl-tRNA synthetase class 2